MSDLENFKAWYLNILNGLYPNRNAGLVVLTVTLPLAERYLRQKNGLGPDQQLSDAVMTDLVRLFPGLRDVTTARKFWAVYRNGFLHQATLSLTTQKGAPLPIAWLTHDIATPIVIRGDGSLCVNPVLFSQAILGEIEANFAVYTGVAAGAPPLLSIARMDPVNIPSTYIGTSNRP